MRRDQRQKSRPRHHRVHLRQEQFPPRLLRLNRIAKTRKGGLFRHRHGSLRMCQTLPHHAESGRFFRRSLGVANHTTPPEPPERSEKRCPTLLAPSATIRLPPECQPRSDYTIFPHDMRKGATPRIEGSWAKEAQLGGQIVSRLARQAWKRRASNTRRAITGSAGLQAPCIATKARAFPGCQGEDTVEFLVLFLFDERQYFDNLPLGKLGEFSHGNAYRLRTLVK